VFLAVHNNFCNFFSCHHKFYFWAQRYWSKRLQKIRGLPEAYVREREVQKEVSAKNTMINKITA
ncbi:hypothetical protein, partial [Bacteroides pyogenes]|uniref:hypothetical protein n=1 Tax=Bacteroides pyogenes TaxID=310300 RepID=UPI001CA3258C